MIRQIKIGGFKSLEVLDLELGTVNCFIGANGVGKSNILEAIGVLGAAAHGRVNDEALKHRGVRPGLPRLYKTSFRGTRVRPHIRLEAASADGSTYRATLLNPLESPEPAWSFNAEWLTRGAETVLSRGQRSDLPNLHPQAGLAALKLVEMTRDDPAAQLLEALQGYAIYSPNTPMLRGLAADPQMRAPVGLAGGGLPEAVAELQRTVLNADEALADEVLGLIDWAADVAMTRHAQKLLSPSVPREQAVLKFTDRFMADGRNQLTAYDASEGALYVLFMAALCLSAGAAPLVAVDNLDQALNPRLVARLTQCLAGWLRRAGRVRQLVFTAHNPAVLDGLDLADDEVRLFTVERNNRGHTVVRRLTLTPELAALQAQYPLSRLWVMGHLGAVPNV